MSDTQAILRRIAALRQRLDQAQAPAANAGLISASPPLATERPRFDRPHDPLQHLEDKVASGSRQNALLDAALRPVAVAAATPQAASPSPRPARLTARAARLLHRGRELLGQLRALADEPLLRGDSLHAAADLYHETAAMLDTVLRTLTAFPEAPGAQARLCDGLDAVLNVVADRLDILRPSLNVQRRQDQQIDGLTSLLKRLARGATVSLAQFRPLAEQILDEARLESPLPFLAASPTNPARFVACHCLTVAQVVARLILGDPHWQGRAHEPILGALLHDAGMVLVPAATLARPGPLTDDQRSRVEKHTRDGGRLIGAMDAPPSWLMDATVSHHERSDGTGYPDGLLEAHLSPLVRVLIVADIYAALCTPRPYRAALEPGIALTDTLRLADQGAIDRVQAERLLRLSFFPVGSVVELSDGCAGVIIAPPPVKDNRIDPTRPLVALLTDSERCPLPAPRHLDLARDGQPSILRLLPAADRRELLGRKFPALAG